MRDRFPGISVMYFYAAERYCIVTFNPLTFLPAHVPIRARFSSHVSYVFLLVFNPLTPVPPVTNLGLSSSSDVITFDQNWHHLYSTSAGGKDLSNDAQIRVIGLREP